MNKKLWIIPFIWVLALAGCTQPVEVDEEAIEQDQTQDDLSMDENVEIIEINTSYEDPDGQTNPLTGRIYHEDWIIKTVEIDAVSWRQEGFHDYVSTNLEWKSLEGLEVDTVSRASLITEEFNRFVSEEL